MPLNHAIFLPFSIYIHGQLQTSSKHQESGGEIRLGVLTLSSASSKPEDIDFWDDLVFKLQF